MRLKGKVALVTGAASGIGRAVTELFFKEGATVFAGDLASRKPVYSAGIKTIHLDVTDEDGWARAVGGIVKKQDRLDVLINNAGIIAYEPLHDLEMKAWMQMIAVDQTGDGIRVNSVHPGFIHTPLTDAQAPDLNEAVIAATPMKRGGQPSEIAYGCLFLASNEASYVTGAELVIDGGYLAQ